jgi:hypothetical protein
MDICEKPFWSDPVDFITNVNLNYVPQCEFQIWNFIVRLLLIGFAIGLIGSIICGPICIALCILLAMVVGFIIIMTTPGKKPAKEMHRREGPAVEVQLTPTIVSSDSISEGFVPYSPQTVSRIVGIDSSPFYDDAAPYSGPALPDYTPPSSRNLFMNVLLDEYKYNPNRPPAAPVNDAVVKQAMDDYFRVQWFSDPTDVFGKTQNQRQFVTQPCTSVPNDQKSFQEWLYKIPGKTCKEGGQYCTTQGSAGVQYTWMGE